MCFERTINPLQSLGTVAGSYVGAQSGKTIAQVALSTFQGAPMLVKIPVTFALELAGSGIGAYIGNRAGKVIDKLCE